MTAIDLDLYAKRGNLRTARSSEQEQEQTQQKGNSDDTVFVLPKFPPKWYVSVR